MPYRKENFASSEFYHVYNRGLLKQKIFLVDEDYFLFLNLVDKFFEEHEVTIHAYTLMPNHFHFLIQQNVDTEGIQNFFGDLQGVYAKKFNKKYARRGGLYEGRFKAVHVNTDTHLKYLVKYIHRNCIKDGLVSNLSEYRWSSHWSYLGEIGERFVTTDFVAKYFGNTDNWKEKYLRYMDKPLSLEKQAYFAKELIDVEF